MRVRALSPTGDYTFGNGVQNYLVNSPQAVAQCVLTALKLFLGEWFLNTGAGVPWLTEIIGFNTASTRDTAIKNAILGVQGVTGIVNYSSVLQGTKLTITNLVVDTAYGTAVVPV